MNLINKSENTIFFLWEKEFSKRDYIRFGIKGYEENGWDIKVLICEPFLFKNIYPYSKTKEFSLKHKNIIVCENIMQVINNLFIYKPYWTADFASSISKKNYFKRLILLVIFSFFSKRIIFKLCKIPDPIYSKRKITSKIFQFFKKLIFRIAEIPWYILAPSKVVISGLSDFKRYKTNSIPAHNLDYDLYLMQNANKSNSKNRGLFIDEDVPFHSDYEILNIEPEVEANKYYSEINSILAKIQDKLNLKILIQLHPRAEKSRSKKYYNYPLSQNKTANQIRNSKLVIGHASTSLQLAILYNIPILLVRTNGWRRNDNLEIYTKAFSKELNIPIYTSRELKNLNEVPKFNLTLYQQYIDNYIKFPGSRDIFSWQIISDYLKKS